MEQKNDFKRKLSEWQAGKMKRDEFFWLGTPSTILIEAGISNCPIIMSQSIIKKVTEKVHKINFEDIRKIPDELNNPLMILRGTQQNSFVILTELQEKERPVVVALYINEQVGRYAQKVNRIASIYGRDNFREYVERQLKENKIIYMDEKRSGWFTRSGLQLPTLVQTTTASNKNIASADETVKDKISVLDSLEQKKKESSSEHSSYIKKRERQKE